MLIDLIPFNRSIPKAEPAYQERSTSWMDAAKNISADYFNEIGQSPGISALAEAISHIELARQIRCGRKTSPLHALFPNVETTRQASAGAVDAFLRAMNDDKSADQVRDSWARAGMGYPHRKDQLALNGMMSVLGLSQALCPEPGSKAALAATRCVIGGACLYKGWQVGAERVYYKLTDELVTLGIPDVMPSIKNAPYPICTAWALPRKSKIRRVLSRFDTAIQGIDHLAPSTSNASRQAAYTELKSAQLEFEALRKKVENYKATSYASQIEWAAYRQRLTTIGGNVAMLSGALAGFGLAGGPVGVAVGTAIGLGISLPLWIGAHLTYHFKGWKAPDNRDKLERALLTAIKSPDLLHRSMTSGTDITLRYVRYREKMKRAIDHGESGSSIEAAFIRELTPLFKMDVVEKAWRRPIGIRIDLAKRLLTGKFALAIYETQQLQARVIAAPYKVEVKELLAESKSKLKALWTDLANFTLFEKYASSFKSRSDDTGDLEDQASTALQRIQDPEVHNLMCGDLEKQMNTGETAKGLTKGELFKYQMTYFTGSMLPDLCSIGLTLPGAVVAYAGNHVPSTEQSPQNAALKLGGFASVVSAANAAEVSAGRARYNIDKRLLYRRSLIPAPAVARHPCPDLISSRTKAFFTQSDVSDKAIEQLSRSKTVPRVVNLFDESAQSGDPFGLEADLTNTEPFSTAHRSRLGWSSRWHSACAVTWVGVKYLGVSLTGLAHRLTASGISMASTRSLRRDLDVVNDQATQILTHTRVASQAPRLPEWVAMDHSDIQFEMDNAFARLQAELY